MRHNSAESLVYFRESERINVIQSHDLRTLGDEMIVVENHRISALLGTAWPPVNFGMGLTSRALDILVFWNKSPQKRTSPARWTLDISAALGQICMSSAHISACGPRRSRIVWSITDTAHHHAQPIRQRTSRSRTRFDLARFINSVYAVNGAYAINIINWKVPTVIVPPQVGRQMVVR